MPPKMFKIKRAEQVKEEDDTAEGLVVSSYQQQRLETQAQNAEGQQREEVKRQLANESSSAAAVSVKKENETDERSRRPNTSGAAAFSSASAGGKTSAPSYTAVTHGVADALPVNTMDVVLAAPAVDSNQYQPLVLNPQAVEMYADRSLVMNENGMMVPATTTATAPVVKSGTAFLEEGHRELLASYAANKEFFDTHGQGPRAHLNSESDNASTAGADDAFMLLQLPRPVRELSSSLSLDQMAPGKVGKLTVYKSGRATMTIGGVTLDVALEPHRQHEGSANAPAVAEGISQYAVAVDSTELARRGCYQLCWIPRKVVCTPRLEEE